MNVFETEKEKKDFLEQVAFYKNRLMSGDKNLTAEEAEQLARQTICNLNLSFVLADVCNSFLSDALGSFKKMGLDLSREDKRRFTLAMEAIRKAKVMVSAYARPLYHMKDTDDACSCSDWYYHFLRLVETRIVDRRKTGMLLEFLLTMPNEEGVFDVKLEDFE